jgi:hypothetical protein
MGIKLNSSVETNDIGKKCNKHLLEPIVRHYFNTLKLDYSLLYMQYYAEMTELFEGYNESNFQMKKSLITNIVKRFKDDNNSLFYCSNA